MYKLIFKPLIDFFLALIAAILLIPVFIAVGIAIKLESKGPAVFKQARLGKNGKIFTVYKFRSMVSDQSRIKKSSTVYENDPRITQVGAFIRKTSIDELPQVFNILKGEMSFIGPRPPVPHYPKKYSDYNEFEKQRFSVKPGISGLAQIRCREIHDWDINIPIDVEYVNNYSFTYDAKLFFASFFTFFKHDNIYTKE
ncbi:Sugar transferase involved in LPS biosynthesis (colanic, teichoic acid) [Saccharicrinis carchari]|uniref:Sugar transferase involved in LPS biosynthesis (Colanic, teichoic acid) n=1 Tax=Saccharicrinis carchari TaxID=1168039 RepID=A0A521BVK6_SACCC|nr:sugar transferase [Saccharicrinis carchari]SMO50450.1 Sugar transferase involved in LPS biosynthesis (colanic, teichoic acid) [Saccharicrinis carchari]